MALAGLVPAAEVRAQRKPGVAASQPSVSERVRAHLDRALSLYKERSYGPAALEFRAAYQLEPSNDYLYAWAQAERLSGNCEAAIPLYERFLAMGPGGANAEIAKINLARCQTAIAPPPAPPPIEIRNEPPPAPPFYLDVPGAFLTGAGLTALGTAGAFRLAANRADRSRREATNYDVFYNQTTTMRRWDGLAVTALLAGTTLVVAGAVRYAYKAWR